MAERDKVWLSIGDGAARREYGGWKSVRVERSIDAVAGGFSIGMADPRNPRILVPKEVLGWPIAPGDGCRVLIGDDVVIDGWIDETAPAISADSHDLSVSGRDRTGDLVDCSADHSPDEWNAPLDQIAAILCRPFGIQVSVAGVDLGAPFAPFKLQPEETAFGAIERMCRMRAVLPMSDGAGGLLLTRAGAARAASAIVEGENLLWAKATYSMKERYSRVTVKGERGKASATDPMVARHRPLIVLAEQEDDGVPSEARARWETTVRAGRAGKVTVAVQGWRQADGSLWPLNAEAAVHIPTLDLSGRLLIAARRLVLDEGGRVTELDLVRRDAYDLLPELPKGKKGTGMPADTEVITSEDQALGRRK